MGVQEGRGAATDLDSLRREYESSLSWRITRPLRAVGRLARPTRPTADPSPAAPSRAPGRLDSWLTHFHGQRLEELDASCAGGEPECFRLFRDLDADLWALLLTQEYEVYPNIRALLPSVPDPALQQVWNGASGVELAAQSKSFYSKLRELYARHSDRPLSTASVLDFGCGWGRLTRFLARDVEPGCLYGCDPVEAILGVCRENGVRARLARTDFLPDRPPFEQRFDLAFAFSVFTHLSEEAHKSCLEVLHESLRPGGVLVVTVRPPEYLRVCERMHPVIEALDTDYLARLEEPRYLFVPHPAEERHLQYAEGDMSYGETVITLSYVRETWSQAFELLDVAPQVGDLHQVILTLRRR